MNKKSKWEISCFGWHNIQGVYCVCSIKNNKTFIHYIGSSKDIGKRINNPSHPYRILYDLGVMAYIKFKQTDDYIELEKKLIGKIKPIMNIQHKNTNHG